MMKQKCCTYEELTTTGGPSEQLYLSLDSRIIHKFLFTCTVKNRQRLRALLTLPPEHLTA